MLKKTQPDELQDYLTDASNMAGGHAEQLFIPKSAGEVAHILREANAKHIPVTVAGARTGTVGGAIPFGGWIVSLEKLDKISINRETRTATVGAGVILAEVQKAVESEGLFYPPDPTEWSCQIGGTVATNASGARSFKYGSTREFVDRLDIILANGEGITVRRGTPAAGFPFPLPPLTYERPNVRKNVSGYFHSTPSDTIDPFIGSEGTLGVITEIELRLIPKPEAHFGGIVFFNSEAKLLSFVDEVRSASLGTRQAGSNVDASLLEYFDDRALNFISEKFPDTPLAAGAIFFEQETSAENEDAIVAAWSEILDKHGADVEQSWFSANGQDREKMREFRHALPVAVNERIVRSGQRKIGTDMAVPDDNFRSYLRYYKEILEESGIDYVIFGHIGDCHLHANLLPKNDEEAERARHIYGRCVAQAIMLGGTVSAEHGIGKLKRKYLAAMMGERYLNEMAAMKRALDPNRILGRGNMFDESYLDSV
ncbi:MAG: FAD-binding oxidoreductase [Pyrinomonadaceae bacterium]